MTTAYNKKEQFMIKMITVAHNLMLINLNRVQYEVLNNKYTLKGIVIRFRT